MAAVFSRRARLYLFAYFLSFVVTLRAEPLSKKIDVDFFRDVPSRNLRGLATRSDGRLVAGPTLSEIAVRAPADLLWCLEPGADATHRLVGAGPDGKILEITFNPNDATYASRDVVKLDDPQVFAVKRLPDGAILAGTSPKGALYLVRAGKATARLALPVDSIFDFLLLDDRTALVATGNPGRVYRIDPTKFEAGGVVVEKISDAKLLADRGVTLFGEIRDRNIRRLAQLANGRIVAGSAPKGTLYTFAHDGGAPVILQENREAEVTDLLPQPNGDLLATIVFASSTGEARITPPKSAGDTKPALELPPVAQAEKFGGRSSVVLFPADGFAETLVSRANAAFYRVLRQGDLLIITGGEQGELFGFDLKAKLGLTYAGSISSQLNGLAPIAGSPGKYLVLRNNAPGLALLDFTTAGIREVETRRLDLGTPALLGALRFNRLRNLADSQLALEARTSNGSDEVEGWGPWTPLKSGDTGSPAGAGWRLNGLRGRYLKLRLRLTGTAGAAVEVDKGTVFILPQNRRPVLQEFRFIAPNYGLVPAVDQPPAQVATLSQLLSPSPRDDDAKRRESFLRSQIVPSPGTQIVFWNVTDPDGDNVTCTFSIRRDGDTNWTDLTIDTHESFTQFDTAHLPDGVYFTRLVATERAPRLPADQLTATFETDDLIVDHTPPEILEATAKRDSDRVLIAVHGRDALSLLQGIEVNFNNGLHEETEQPDDGIRDSRDERFTIEVPLAKISNATSAEVTLYDASGNSVSKRVSWPAAK